MYTSRGCTMQRRTHSCHVMLFLPSLRSLQRSVRFEKQWSGAGYCFDCARNDANRSRFGAPDTDRIAVTLVDGSLEKRCLRCGSTGCRTTEISAYDFSIHFDRREDRDWKSEEFGMFLAARAESPYGNGRWYPAPWHDLRLGLVGFDKGSNGKPTNTGRFLEDSIQKLGLEIKGIYDPRPISGSPDSVLGIAGKRICDLLWDARERIDQGWFPAEVEHGSFVFARAKIKNH